MVSFLNLPRDIIVMVCDELHSPKDLCRLASTHRILSYASQRSRKLHTAQCIRRTVWKEDAFTEAEPEAVDRVLGLAQRMSPAQANTQLDIHGPLMKPHKYVGGNPIEHGSKTTHYTCTLLHLACYSGLDDLVGHLLAHGANKNEDIHYEGGPTNQTAIEIAAYCKHVHIMRRLAQAGAHINLRCAHWAIHHNSLPSLQLLFEFKAQLSEDSTLVDLLYYAAVGRRDKEDRTPLVEFILHQNEHQSEAAMADVDNRRYLFEQTLWSRAFPMALALARNGFATTADDVQEACCYVPDSRNEEDDLLEILRCLLERLRIQRTQEEDLMNHLSLWRIEESWVSRLREVMRAHWNKMDKQGSIGDH